MTQYTITLRTLTPLHIGDGLELKLGFDLAIIGKRTYRLDEDAILEAKFEQISTVSSGKYKSPVELLSGDDWSNPKFSRYSLPGVPRSTKIDARVRSFIKDPRDRPYIPGSSLKGALRTALAWSGWSEIRPRLDRSAIGRSKSWAGQPLERKLFGPNPNHDLLRALQVSDLFGPQKPGEGLILVNAQVLTRRSSGSPIEVEAIRGDTEFHGSLVIDEKLFSPWAEKELGFGRRRQWLEQLLPRVQKHSLARIRELAAWFDQAENCASIARFYHELSGVELGPDQALLQIGWGAGWDAKTFWTHLLEDSHLFEQLVREFRLHRAGKGSPPRNAGDPFPRSKRAAMLVKDKVARPAASFGWVLLEMNPS